MMIKGHVDARPWKPQDLIDDLQKMIDEEPDAYLNDRCTTLCTARDYLKEYFNTYLPEQKKAIDNGLPLHYYPVYRKALRDLKDGIEKVGDGFKMYSMNNWKGMIAVIDMVLADPEKLMYSASLEGYEVPEPYLTKFRAWQKKQKEKLEAERNAKSSGQVQKEMLPACRSCNHYKSRSTLEGFRKMVENMPAALMRDSVTYKNAVRFGLVTPTPHPVKFYFEQIGR